MQVIPLGKLNARRKIRNAAIAAVIAAGVNAGIGAAAPAADIVAPVPYTKAPVAPASWTGFYLGAGVGFRSANISEQTLSARDTFDGDLMNIACLAFVCGTTQSLDHTAFRFSPYFGYNWQIGTQWLIGVEGEVGFGGKTSTINGVPLPGAGDFSIANADTDSFAVKTDWDASARTRVGYLVTPTFLIYATGGAAWQRVEATSTCGLHNSDFACGKTTGSITGGPISHATTMPGYTVGGGLETMVWNNWLLRGEFRHSDVGSITNTDVRSGTFTLTASYKLRLTKETAFIGVAYKF